MIIGPKYKIARRLGAPVFEKTQGQKFALHLERKNKNKSFGKAKSEFGIQMNEKQKAKFTYCLSERQFSNYIKEALLRKNTNPTQIIYEFLESRLDNVVYRLGLSGTRLGARQLVSHGHILVNGRRVNTPSMRLKIGDKLEIANRSVNKGVFSNLDSKTKDSSIPNWLSFDYSKKTAEVKGKPQLVKTENNFDLNAVIEFYSR